MAKKSVAEIIQLATHIFTNQSAMLGLYQTLADNFYPERADFTVTRNVGVELADNLVDSYPIIVRRDLCNSFSAMLRQGDWFQVGVDGEPDHMGNLWLDWSTQRLKKLINHRSANFTRTTKQGDHDFGTFGQCVISVERNRKANGLLFRNWHLRDCAWTIGCDDQIETVVRKWRPTIFDVLQYFKRDALHSNMLNEADKNPFKDCDIKHVVIPSAMYGDDFFEERFKFVSLYVDCANHHLIEEVGINQPYYVIPRFQTIAGSPYAYSPATVAGLPDARTLQAMTFTLLEAAERYARPPILATQQVVRGDIDLSADGITWLDKEYDERLGAGLRPLTQDRGGFPIGYQMRDTVTDVLSSAFYLNKLTLPEVGREMTAYEVAERMKQFRRENLPLFAPLESEYNGALCEAAFGLALESGMLGSPYDIPPSLQDKDVVFKFESPLKESEEEKRESQFRRTSQMLAEAVALDPAVAANVDFDNAVRDAITGIGAPSRWLRSTEEVLQSRQAQAMQQMAEQVAQVQPMQ